MTVTAKRASSFDLPLAGPAGEPIDLWRTLASHGIASLPPMVLDEDARRLEVTLSTGAGRPRTVRVIAAPKGQGRVEILGRPSGRAGPEAMPDDEVAGRLLALPGVGPYAAAHVMMLVGRHSRLILDSWTRPTYARLVGRRVGDDAIVRRFRRYGSYAGLAFWLFLTRDWVAELEASSASALRLSPPPDGKDD
jgi:hypothetical protein